MRKGILFVFTLGLIVSMGTPAPAQQPSAGPPPVLQIVREDIKTGMMEAHSREANATVRIWAKAKSPHHRLALVPVAGNENEVTYLWPFESMAAFEKAQRDLDRIGETYKADFARTRHAGEDYHSAQRDMVARLRPDLSYIGGPADIAHSRYMRVETIRVRPGHASEWEEARKIMTAAHEKAKVDERMAVYQVMGGAQSGTYIVVIPWKSLAEADGVQPLPHGKAYQDALGGGEKKIASLSSDSIAFNDVSIYAFNPQLSYAFKEWVDADPGYWVLKPISAPASPAKKKAPAKADEKTQ